MLNRALVLILLPSLLLSQAAGRHVHAESCGSDHAYRPHLHLPLLCDDLSHCPEHDPATPVQPEPLSDEHEEAAVGLPDLMSVDRDGHGASSSIKDVILDSPICNVGRQDSAHPRLSASTRTKPRASGCALFVCHCALLM